MFYTYVIRSKIDGKYYTGATKDLRKRLNEHNAKKVFSTKHRAPFELIYYEACMDEIDARVREKYLKSGMGKRYIKNRLKRFLSLTGFTLIELISVIGIILVLIGIGIPAYNSWVSRGKIAEANAVIAKIEMALELYKTDFGSYPQKTSSSNLNADGLIRQFLVNTFTVGSVTYGPYMEFRGTYNNNILLDPWGTQYCVYTAPGSTGDSNFRHNINSYYVYSFGSDKANNTADDLDNFKK